MHTLPLAEPSRVGDPFLPPAFDEVLSVDFGRDGLFFLSLSGAAGDLFPFDGDVLPPLGDLGLGGALTFLTLSATSLSCSIFHALSELWLTNLSVI